jgi:abortive infection bacteriophage resistance protein
MEKKFLTYDQQLEHLEQRGVAIPDASAAVDALSRKSYYNIVNGYRRLFLDQSSVVDNGPYKKGTRLDELDSLLVFDGSLRIVCLKRILAIELLVKSTIAYEFSGKYGTDSREYLDPANFSAEEPECRFVAKTLETIRDEMERARRESNLSICHYLDKYECIPLWALMNVLSFGTTVYFNYCMQREDRVLVAKRFDLSQSDFNRILRALKDYRNRCVHGGRLYDYSAVPTHLISQTRFYKKVVSMGGSGAADGLDHNDFFTLLIAMKTLLHPDEFLQLTRDVRGLLEGLQGALNTISIAEVEAAMGLPEHWGNLLIT